MKAFMCICSLFMLVFSSPAYAAGTLGPDQRIESQFLGHSLHYRIYRPEAAEKRSGLPVLYITDGSWYIDEGKVIEHIAAFEAQAKSQPFIAVFLDSTDPDNPKINRRNEHFMCNAKFAQFFAKELIPAIEAQTGARPHRDARSIMGLSFGGTNAACFGLMLTDYLASFAMQSPANDKHLGILNTLYGDTDLMPVKIFFSVGTKNDNVKAARTFMKTLKKKGYDLTYVEVDQGHDWKNWGPLIPRILDFFYGGRADEPCESQN